jgi:hypothetical protein
VCKIYSQISKMCRLMAGSTPNETSIHENNPHWSLLRSFRSCSAAFPYFLRRKASRYCIRLNNLNHSLMRDPSCIILLSCQHVLSVLLSFFPSSVYRRQHTAITISLPATLLILDPGEARSLKCKPPRQPQGGPLARRATNSEYRQPSEYHNR